jgi:hypothetical protein
MLTKIYLAGRLDPLKGGAKRLGIGAKRLGIGEKRPGTGAKRLDTKLISSGFLYILARFFACAMVEN